MIDLNAFVKTLNDRPVAVFGLGVSNMAVIKALKKADAKIWAWDDAEIRRKDAEKAGAIIRDLTEADLTSVACLVLAPGVPLHHPEPHPVVENARASNREIFCDLEILHRLNHGRKTIGVTGTNGKSTTTAMIGHVLKECGRDVAVGGNIGKAVMALDMLSQDGVFVFEMSSYQLDLCPTFSPDIAVHLNISPDHLDRHGTMKKYIQSKAYIFSGEGAGVIAVDDKESRGMYDVIKEKSQRRTVPVSGQEAIDGGVYVENFVLYDEREGKPGLERAISTMALKGVHNQQNIVAAYTACTLAGCDAEQVCSAIESFSGLPHRQYVVRRIDGVAYVNDSKATNANAASKALASFRNIYWILGGIPKEGGLSGLEPYMDRVRHAFLIGESMDDFASWLDKHGVPAQSCGTMDVAVRAAYDTAQAERGKPGGAGTVLLSPACASFDQFSNFEERGDKFTALVMQLEEQKP